ASPTLAWSALHAARSSRSRCGFATSDSTDSMVDSGSGLPQAARITATESKRNLFMGFSSRVAIEIHAVGRVRRALAHEAPAHFARPLMHRHLPRLLQRGGAVLRELQLLRLDGLPGLQGQQLVRR